MTLIKEFIANTITDHNFNAGDVSAGVITIGALFQLLPYISAMLSIIWIALRIYVLIRDEIFGKKKVKEVD